MTKPTGEHLPMTVENFQMFAVKSGTLISKVRYWKKGYFHTIANIPLTEEEKNLDFGFYKLHCKGNFFCKETGELLDKEPKILGMHGITTIIGIGLEIERELIINPSLLEETE